MNMKNNAAKAATTSASANASSLSIVEFRAAGPWRDGHRLVVLLDLSGVRVLGEVFSRRVDAVEYQEGVARPSTSNLVWLRGEFEKAAHRMGDLSEHAQGTLELALSRLFDPAQAEPAPSPAIERRW